jgi:acyl-CoA thioesterase
MDYMQTAKEFFKNEGYAIETTGIEIEHAEPQNAVCTLAVQDKHKNSVGVVMGGAIYTLADFAFAVLGNYLHPFTVTQSGNIHYLRPAYTSKITAAARETACSGHTSLCEVEIVGEEGKTLCVCHFTGFIKQTDREELINKYSV